MARMFERADEGEKLALVRAAKQIGAADLIGARGRRRLAARPGRGGRRRARRPGLRAAATLSAALADFDPQVRKAALERLAAQKDKLEPGVLDRTLALAVRDPDPELSQLALTTIARVAAKDAVVARLHRALGSRAERERAQAAAAAIGLVDRDAALVGPAARSAARRSVARRPRRDAAGARRRLREDQRRRRSSPASCATPRPTRCAGWSRPPRSSRSRAPTPAAPPPRPCSARSPRTGRRWRSRPRSSSLGLIANKADGMAFLQELVP